jgi:hypothetical protein
LSSLAPPRDDPRRAAPASGDPKISARGDRACAGDRAFLSARRSRGETRRAGGLRVSPRPAPAPPDGVAPADRETRGVGIAIAVPLTRRAPRL